MFRNEWDFFHVIPEAAVAAILELNHFVHSLHNESHIVLALGVLGKGVEELSRLDVRLLKCLGESD